MNRPVILPTPVPGPARSRRRGTSVNTVAHILGGRRFARGEPDLALRDGKAAACRRIRAGSSELATTTTDRLRPASPRSRDRVHQHRNILAKIAKMLGDGEREIGP